jgi:hypothetical protein
MAQQDQTKPDSQPAPKPQETTQRRQASWEKSLSEDALRKKTDA